MGILVIFGVMYALYFPEIGLWTKKKGVKQFSVEGC
jgi:hypothetical protein